MAGRLDLFTPDAGAADTDRPDGFYQDEDAGVVGTPVLQNMMNSFYYFFSKMMKQSNITFNGLVDNITNNQFFDALTSLTTGRDNAVSEWAAGTFNVNDVVNYFGKQFYCGVDETINTPGPNSQWVLSKTLNEYLYEATSGKTTIGDLIPLNNLRDVVNYNSYFKMGKFDWNNKKWEAWRINIDGSAHISGTSDIAKLLAEYKFSAKVIDSNVAGTLTLKDYSGTVESAIDASLRGNIGDRQEDAFQGHKFAQLSGNFYNSTSGSGAGQIVGTNNATGPESAIVTMTTQGIVTDGVNGTPRTDSESRIKNVSKGMWGITVLVEEGTI